MEETCISRQAMGLQRAASLKLSQLTTCSGVSTTQRRLRPLAVAWNGSLEASRAVAMTLDLVARAEAVTIPTFDEDPKTGKARELHAFVLRPAQQNAHTGIRRHWLIQRA